MLNTHRSFSFISFGPKLQLHFSWVFTVQYSVGIIVKVAQLCLTLWKPMEYTLHGIIQARMEWVAIPFSRVSSQLRDWTQVLPAQPQGKPTIHIVVEILNLNWDTLTKPVRLVLPQLVKWFLWSMTSRLMSWAFRLIKIGSIGELEWMLVFIIKSKLSSVDYAN